jgi:hypothetical protein
MGIRLWIPAKFQTKIQMRIVVRIQRGIEEKDERRKDEG